MTTRMKPLMAAALLGAVAIAGFTVPEPQQAAAQTQQQKKVRAEVGASCECKDGVCRYLSCTFYVEVSKGPFSARLEAEGLFRDAQGRQGNRIKGEIRVTLLNY